MLMPHHAKAAGWTIEHSRRWFTHCDQCGTWHVVADYYEVYPPLDSEGDEAGWWWACSRCLLDIASTMLEDTMEKMEALVQQREERLTDAEAISDMMAHPPCHRMSDGTGWNAKFKCSVHGDPWPDPEGECLKQENLG